MNSPGHLRVRAKICGITSREDAVAAISAGADALGFNTWPGTPRYVDLAQAAEWIAALPPFVTKVALLVNAPMEDAEHIARLPFIDAIQLHGDEGPEYCRQIARTGRPLIKALRLRSQNDFSQISEYSTRQFLIDAYRPGSFGGTGELADLTLAAEFRRLNPELHVVLAGGLNPENVGAAIRSVGPYAVDVSSGVENAPGKKDAARMRAFVRAVRGASSDG